MTNASPLAPLAGVRVLNIGGAWAGRLASLLLAEQGADVIELQRPGRAPRAEDALLGRGKRITELDFTNPDERQRAQALAAGADIVIDNLRPGRAARAGLDAVTFRSANPGLVYIAIPAFATGSPLAAIPAWEGTVAASTGVYTDIHSTGPILGGAPIYTAIPMASAYGGVHAAVAATTALLHRLNTGEGQHVEVPLADAVISAMALLAMQVEGQPRRYDLPPIEKGLTEVAFPILRNLHAQLTASQRSQLQALLARAARPQFANYRCADGRFIFINAVDHIHHSPACLDVLGLRNRLVAEGMVIGSPYQEGGAGNNICASTGLSPEWATRLKTLMTARFLERPAAEWERLLRKAGVPASEVRTTQEWLAWPAAQAGGNVCQLDDPQAGLVTQAGRFLTLAASGCASTDLQARQFAEAPAWRAPRLDVAPAAGDTGWPLAGLRVLDLSNVIAGPAAGRTLAELGADVIRIDPPAPFAGPRMTMWFGIDVNQGKRALILDLKSARGRELLGALIRRSDVVLHNFLDGSAESLGISDAQLKQLNPDVISCQISAWGGPSGGPLKDDPAFDPVLQAATGITARYGKPDAPALHGLASCVDYITGFTAALGIVQALLARRLGRGAAHVRTSLSMGAQLVQFPFVSAGAGLPVAAEPHGQEAVGDGAHHRIYQLRDGHAFLACRPADLAGLADRLEAATSDADGLGRALAATTLEEATARLRPIDTASLVPVRRLDELQRDAVLPSAEAFDRRHTSFAMVQQPHPSGHRVTLPLPTWLRADFAPVRPLSPAPAPGAHSRQVLGELGIDEPAWQDLRNQRVVGERWEVLQHYLPL